MFKWNRIPSPERLPFSQKYKEEFSVITDNHNIRHPYIDVKYSLNSTLTLNAIKSSKKYHGNPQQQRCLDDIQQFCNPSRIFHRVVQIYQCHGHTPTWKKLVDHHLKIVPLKANKIETLAWTNKDNNENFKRRDISPGKTTMMTNARTSRSLNSTLPPNPYTSVATIRGSQR